MRQTTRSDKAVNFSWVNIPTCLASTLGRPGVQTVWRRCLSMCLPFIFHSASAPNWCAQLVHTNFAWAELGLRAKGSPVVLAGDGLNNDGSQSDTTHVQRQRSLTVQRAYKYGFITQRELVAFLYSLREKWKMILRMMPGNLGLYSFPFSISIIFECLKYIPVYWTEYSHCFFLQQIQIAINMKNV